MFIFRIGGGGMVVKNPFKCDWSQMLFGRCRKIQVDIGMRL